MSKQFLIDLYDGLDDDLFVNLCAISTNGEIDGSTFSLAQICKEDVVQQFIDSHEGMNIYFGLNPLWRKPHGVRASKEDVDEDIWFSHGDIDPPNGAELKPWRAATRVRLKGQQFSALWDTGGGYQVAWRLVHPVSHTRGEEINKMWVDHPTFKADNAASDVARLMRLPGTINHLNEKKRKAGREPAPAVVVEIRTTAFEEDSFVRATDLDDIDEATRIAIVDAEKVNEDGERRPYPGPSEARMAVMVRMFARGHSEDRVRQIITNHHYAIAPSNKKKLDKDRWISQELARARAAYERTIPDYVRELNDEYFATSVEGKFVIGSEVFDENFGRHRFVWTNDTALQKLLANEDPTMVRRWMNSRHRRTYAELVMRPDLNERELVDDKGRKRLNMWRGFSVDPVAGTCPLFDELVNEIICDGDAVVADYFWKWMAYGVQHPERQAEVALVMRGGRGTGKGTFANVYGRLFGSHYVTISNQVHLTGNFNDHLLNCLCLFADEALWAGSKQAASTLKALITEPFIAVEAKFMPVRNVRNMLKIIMASNEDWVVPAGLDERRFAVVNVSEKRQQDNAWFGKLHAEMKGGGMAALLSRLKAIDLSEFDIRIPPQTKALDEQKDESMDNFSQWWADELNEGEHVYCDCDRFSWEIVPRDHLFEEYMKAYRRKPVNGGPTNKIAFGRRLAEVIPERFHENTGGGVKRGPRVWQNIVKEQNKEVATYEFPPLHVCREYFCEVMGREFGFQKRVVTDDEPEF